MSVKEQIIEALRENGYDYLTAAEIATTTIKEFLASGDKERTYWLVNGHFQITLRRKTLIEKASTMKFALGEVVSTPGAMEAMESAGQTPEFFLEMHAVGNWGEVDDEDKNANDQALIDEGRILSAYRTLRNVRIWVITEADRSSTCLLLPDEY